MNSAICKALAIVLFLGPDLVTPQTQDAQRSGSQLSKEQVLTRWADALGGRAALQNVVSVHLRGSIETSGLKGTYERWTSSRGEFRTSVDLAGAFRQVNVFDGRTGWMLGTSGTAHEISGDARRALLSAAYEASYSFLFPGRVPGAVEFEGERSDQDAYVLYLTPDNGDSVTVYLDAKTFLPKREETSGPMGKRVITFSDWREFGGIKVPRTVHQSNGGPKFDAVITMEQVEVNAPIAPGLFEEPGSTAEQVHFADGKHEAVLPAEVYGDHIFLAVGMNGGETAWFFLDSGAGMSVVSHSWAKKIGLAFDGAVRGQGTGAGSASMGLASNVAFELGTAKVPPATVAVWDFSSLVPVLGRQWDGLLGYDVISRLVVRMDYEHRQITLYDPAAFVPGDHSTAFPVTFLGSLPVVRAKITLPGRETMNVECAIDSGADGFHLSTLFTNANHVLASVQRTISGYAIGAGGGSKEFVGRIVSLQLGPYVLREPITAFSPDHKEGLLASPDIGALIGGEILKRFTVTFDYPHHQILLEPNGHFSDRFLANESGLALLARGPDLRLFEVDEVEPGSPAASAGVLKGDVLTALDGHLASELDLSKIDEILQEPGRTIPMTIQRKRRSRKVVLHLKERI
ncbi:MAG TPA: aspartyl protease family protein [Candidatus Acidoferrum sp.]|nr:aspartyl protease family protein [Candidatus Acidoferrum sp.]